ncbi:MAG: ATP-binding cassette domain-containing protein [Chloroflexota bacterium]|nr:ATP-binding cassette domain-containing protein [Chloroflexota bacterium]
MSAEVVLDEKTDVTPILALRGISKYFGHVRALDSVDFEVLPGEILALVGDNGAGKSTLIKIASGVYQPDAGQVYVDGEPVEFHSPHDARGYGIATVHQDLALADDRDVASNLFLGREPTRFFMVDKGRMNREARQVLNRLRINIPSVETMVGWLSGGQRQAVAIGRAIAQGGRVFIMDEPTAALGVRESAKVLQLILGLREEGSSVVVISHNMRHVFSIADRITVLRNGQKVGTRVRRESSADDIVRMITGADMLVASTETDVMAASPGA